MTLAPHAAKLIGRQTVQFYVADGRYRMQVFALEDLQDGKFTVYCPDVLAEAAEAGLLAPPAHPDSALHVVARSGEPLHIEQLDGNSVNPAAHFKDMMGWNRKALRITLPPTPSAAQVEATELLCALAAGHFVRPRPGRDRDAKGDAEGLRRRRSDRMPCQQAQVPPPREGEPQRLAALRATASSTRRRSVTSTTSRACSPTSVRRPSRSSASLTPTASGSRATSGWK